MPRRLHLPSGCLLLFLLALIGAGQAWAEGDQFTGNCQTISWDASTVVDLAGYKLYDQLSPTATPTLLMTVGPQITSLSCALFHFNPGQHYLSITAFLSDRTESPHSSLVPFVIVLNQVSDLRVTSIGDTTMSLTFTEVDDGLGQPASYDIRLATPIMNWGSASSVSSGTCSTPVSGTAIGATKTCTVTGLSGPGTAYQFQLVPFRGTLGGNAIFGPLSNIASATTGGEVPGATQRTILFIESFDRADDLTGLGPDWEHGFLGRTNLALVGGAARGTVVYDMNSTERVAPARATFLHDQWLQAVIKTWNPNGGRIYFSLVLLAPATGATLGPAYLVNAIANGYSSATTEIKRLDAAGTQTLLDSETATTWAAGDTLDFEVQWNPDTETNDLIVRRNGEVLVQTTDAVLTGVGQPALNVWLVDPTTVADVDIESVQAGGFVSTAETCGCDNH